jgi:hypothetical protein
MPWFVAAVVVAGAGIVALAALLNDQGPRPPTSLFAASGIVVATVGAVCVGLAVRATGLPVRVTIALAGSFVCIAFAKFVFGPLGFYEVNQTRLIETALPADPSLPVVAFSAVAVLALYAAVLWLIVAWFQRRLPDAGRWRPVTPGVVAVVLVAGTGFLTGAVVLGVGPDHYVDFVFTSSAALAVAVSIVAATACVTIAFGSAADAVRATGEAATYASLAVVALGFLVVFHVLWVVYMLVLISIWPLRTVTPK